MIGPDLRRHANGMATFNWRVTCRHDQQSRRSAFVFCTRTNLIEGRRPRRWKALIAAVGCRDRQRERTLLPSFRSSDFDSRNRLSRYLPIQIGVVHAVVRKNLHRFQAVVKRNRVGAVQQVGQAAVKRKPSHSGSMLLRMAVSGRPSRINRQQVFFRECQCQQWMPAIDAGI